MQKQMYPYLNQIFSKYQCGFRKGHNAQYFLMAMIEKWRKFLDIGRHAGGPLTDLSKAFDCIYHELLIAKLHAYGFDTDVLKFIYSYFRGRKHRTKINSSYSYFAEILFSVPQGSILGPLLINAYMCDRFHNIIDKIFDWFLKKKFKGNADKCHLITISKNPVGIEVSEISIMREEKVKLLVIYIDNRLNFTYHISQLCKKAGKKLHALTRIIKYMKISQRKLIANAQINVPVHILSFNLNVS